VLAAIVAVRGERSHDALEQLTAAGARLRRTSLDERHVALFDGPATAVRAGLGLLQQRREVALGVHVVEVSRGSEPLSGRGLGYVTDLAAIAPAGQLWASKTVRDLLAGSGVELEAVGVQELAGIGPQRVFAVTP
jgi:class 3 adenylate cyclase